MAGCNRRATPHHARSACLCNTPYRLHQRPPCGCNFPLLTFNLRKGLNVQAKHPMLYLLHLLPSALVYAADAQRASHLPHCLPPCRGLRSQINGLVKAWKWRSDDTIVHTLPLHHIHGIVNALYCPASVGAHVRFMPKFSAAQLWEEMMVRQ